MVVSNNTPQNNQISCIYSLMKHKHGGINQDSCATSSCLLTVSAEGQLICNIGYSFLFLFYQLYADYTLQWVMPHLVAQSGIIGKTFKAFHFQISAAHYIGFFILFYSVGSYSWIVYV